MIDGVRMRLSVTVWNITVDTATATPTSAIASSLVPRNGSTKSHEPFAPTVMNASAATRRVAPRPMRIQRGRRFVGGGGRGVADDGGRCVDGSGPGAVVVGRISSDTCVPPQQHDEEEGGADDADHHADRHLVRVAHRTTHE